MNQSTLPPSTGTIPVPFRETLWSESHRIQTRVVNGRIQIDIDDADILDGFVSGEGFLTALLIHPKLAHLTESEYEKIQKAYESIDELPFKQRKSGEEYRVHLERTTWLYVSLIDSPTSEGIIAALHHDSFEDFPESIKSIEKAIGVNALEVIAALSKTTRWHSSHAAHQSGSIAQILIRQQQVHAIIDQHQTSLAWLAHGEFWLRATTSGLVTHRLFSMVEQIRKSMDAIIGYHVLPIQQDPHFVAHIGELYTTLYHIREHEDIPHEIALLISLVEHASDEGRFVKFAGDRVDNLADFVYIEQMIASWESTSEKLDRAIRSRQKMIATTRVYIYLIEKYGYPPLLAVLLDALIRENEVMIEEWKRRLATLPKS